MGCGVTSHGGLFFHGIPVPVLAGKPFRGHPRYDHMEFFGGKVGGGEGKEEVAAVAKVKEDGGCDDEGSGNNVNSNKCGGIKIVIDWRGRGWGGSNGGDEDSDNNNDGEVR